MESVGFCDGSCDCEGGRDRTAAGRIVGGGETQLDFSAASIERSSHMASGSHTGAISGGAGFTRVRAARECPEEHGAKRRDGKSLTYKKFSGMINSLDNPVFINLHRC